MQFSDFISVGSSLGDTVKTVFFKMLPPGDQIQKVRQEIIKKPHAGRGSETKWEMSG
jgi:hypothetical protein